MADKRGGHREFVRRLSKRWDVPFDTAMLFYKDLVEEMRDMVLHLEPIRFQGFGVITPAVTRRRWGRSMSFYACPLCDTGVKATPIHVINKHKLTFQEFCSKYGQPEFGQMEARQYLTTVFRLYADSYKQIIGSNPLKDLLAEEEESLAHAAAANGEPADIR